MKESLIAVDLPISFILHSVTLSWEQTVYNGKYLKYKLSPQRNWVQFAELASNLPELFLPIKDLSIEDAQGNPLYHHYKVLAENFSGMVSTQEHILNIYNADTWQDIGGIGAE